MVERSFLRDSASVFLTKLVVILLTVAASVCLARGLGAENRGLLAALLVYPLLLISVAEGGMRQAATFFIGKGRATEGAVLGSLTLYVACAGALGYALVAVLIWQVGGEKFSLPMVFLAAAIIPTTLYVNAFRGYFLGKQKIGNFNRSAWLERIVYLVLILGLYASGSLTVVTAVIATCFAALVNAVQAGIYVAKIRNEPLNIDWKTLRGMLRVGLVYAVALFLINANYKIDVLMLDLMSIPSEVGYYAVSVQVSELMWQLPGAVMVVLMARSANNRDNSGSWSIQVAFICRVLLLVTLCSALIMVLLVLFGFTLVFGSEYEPAIKIAVILLASSVFMIPFKTLNADLAGEGRPEFSIFIMIPSVVVNVALNFVLIPRFGALGSAAATFFSYLTSGLLIVATYSYLKKIPVRSILLIKSSDFRDIWTIAQSAARRD